ncbi:unnamed protein product [Closterium sp. NIES-65]|nr:unnamed protein product [Closterium sp. NIES-65]
MIPISDFDQHARRLIDPDQTPLQRLQLATEVRDSIEIAHTAEYGNFLRAYFHVFVAVLRQLTTPQVFRLSSLHSSPTPFSFSPLPLSPNPPSPRLFSPPNPHSQVLDYTYISPSPCSPPPPHAQLADNLEHKFRNVVLEVLNRLPHSEALQPYVPELLRAALTVLATDNEDNAMVALRIIFDLHKNFRPKLEHDVQPFLDFVCKIYQSFPATVSFFFDEGGGGEQMRRAAGMGDGAAGGAAGAGAGAGGLGGGPGGVGGGGGAGVAVPSQLNPSTRSFRVVTECPLIVMFLFQVYPRYAGHSISVLLPLMMQCIAIVGPSPHHHVPPRLKAAYADLKAAQIKTVSFLTYLLRGYADIIRPHEANIAKSIVNLLLTCPDVVATRKELLVATRHVLATDFKRGFFPQLDTLLDERVLVGTGRACYDTLRPLAYSLLAELIHHLRDELSLGQASLIAFSSLHCMAPHCTPCFEST